MNRTISSIAILVVALVIQAPGQPLKPVPVYPGATLVVEKSEGAEPECCDFVTNDALANVVTFYERQLKTKALDTKALVAKYPVIKQQVEAIAQQIPSGAVLRAFVLEEVNTGGTIAPILFEVVGSPQGVFFSIGGDALTGNDAMFAKQWREKTGKLTEEEKTQKESEQRQNEEDKEQADRDARKAKEEPQYFAKMTTELVKLLKQNNIDLAPSLQCETIERQEGESSSAYAFYFTSPDDFKKVYDFYASRTKAAPISNEQGNGAGWSKYDHVSFWRTAEFAFGDALRIQVLEFSQAMDGPKKTSVMMRVSSADVQVKLQEIRQEHESRW